MSEAKTLIALGVRLDDVLATVRELEADMKHHAVYSPQHMDAAHTALCHAKTGLAQSIGYAVVREARSAKPTEAR